MIKYLAANFPRNMQTNNVKVLKFYYQMYKEAWMSGKTIFVLREKESVLERCPSSLKLARNQYTLNQITHRKFGGIWENCEVHKTMNV